MSQETAAGESVGGLYVTVQRYVRRAPGVYTTLILYTPELTNAIPTRMSYHREGRTAEANLKRVERGLTYHAYYEIRVSDWSTSKGVES